MSPHIFRIIFNDFTMLYYPAYFSRGSAYLDLTFAGWHEEETKDAEPQPAELKIKCLPHQSRRKFTAAFIFIQQKHNARINPPADDNRQHEHGRQR
jgi:hypothetical protein